MAELEIGMSVEASQNYKLLQSIESKILLHDLLEEKDKTRYASYLRRFAVSIVLCVGYGRRVQSLDDPIVVANQKTDELANSAQASSSASRFLQWFRREPEAQRERDTELYLSLMNDVQRQMDLGLAQPSTGRRALEMQADFGLNDLETAYAFSAPFAAGAGTTLVTLDVFFLAMLHYQEIMSKAQVEIDTVVGSNRLPDFDDEASMPYVQAIVKEILRFGLLRALHLIVISEDTYDDTHIPNGSTVFANIYSMSNDEEMFPSPEEFRPERYMEGEQSSSLPHSTFFFGFGRRICSGMHIAHNSLFIVITRILWAFNITPPRDGEGKSVLPSTDDFIGGLVIRPRSFAYSLESRKEGVQSLIVGESGQATEEASAWM
ncbi:cytochrome P450 [Flammula alnicola]|nr:cytochrome P450 [Flammula alnicola]